MALTCRKIMPDGITLRILSPSYGFMTDEVVSQYCNVRYKRDLKKGNKEFRISVREFAYPKCFWTSLFCKNVKKFYTF